MPVYHRTQRLQIFGQKPEVEKLYGNRYRMTVRCVAANDTKAWYDDNKAQIFADFGTLYDAQMSVDGIPARTGEAYDNMALVKNEAAYTQSGEYVIIFTYETLTDAFLQNTSDKVDFENNGLMRITRSVVALAGSEYDKEVGTVTSITSAGHGDPATPVTLYLASAVETSKRDYEVGYVEIIETWMQAGILNRGTVDLDDGSLQQRVTSYLAVEPTALGIVTSRQVGSFEGLSTFTVTEVLTSTGSALSPTSPTLVKTTSSLERFSVPGLVSLRESSNSSFQYLPDSSILGIDYINYSFDLRGPVDVSCPSQVLEYIQTEGEIQSADYSLGGATGLWSPGSWASSRVSGVDVQDKPFTVSKAYRGYRVPENLIRFNVDSVTGRKYASGLERYISSPRVLDSEADSRIQIAYVDGYRMSHKVQPLIEIGGGPENPVGKKYVTDIQIEPDFSDADGTVYYRKTVTVQDVIGDAVDDAVSGDSTDNILASYSTDSVTAAGGLTAYTLELDSSLFSSEADYYAGGTIDVYARDMNSANEFKDIQRFIINSYDPVSNKILLESDITDSQAAGRYKSGSETDINNYEFARIAIQRYDIEGTIAEANRVASGVFVTAIGEFIPSRQRTSTFDYDGWSLELTSGTNIGNSFPINIFTNNVSKTKTNVFRFYPSTDAVAMLVAGETFKLTPPRVYTWPTV